MPSRISTVGKPRYKPTGPGSTMYSTDTSKFPVSALPAGDPPRNTVPAPSGGYGFDGSTPPSPFDAEYEQGKTALGNQKSNRIGRATYGEERAASDYGFTLKRGPQGNVSGYDVDVSNPFSKMALLQRSFEQGKRGLTNSYAAQGQLYAGSLQNAQDEHVFGFQREEDSLKKGFGDIVRGYSDERIDAQNDYDVDLSNLGWTKLLRLLGGDS